MADGLNQHSGGLVGTVRVAGQAVALAVLAAALAQEQAELHLQAGQWQQHLYLQGRDQSHDNYSSSVIT